MVVLYLFELSYELLPYKVGNRTQTQASQSVVSIYGTLQPNQAQGENVLFTWIVTITHSTPETTSATLFWPIVLQTLKRDYFIIFIISAMQWHEDKQLDWSSMKETHNKTTDMISYGPFLWPYGVKWNKKQIFSKHSRVVVVNFFHSIDCAWIGWQDKRVCHWSSPH